ncbi:MAG TPA: extensin family protein [Xanthobacteraceae bacterium]|nr:extensin family protein [Xanthobacteraceae bacterium]
MTRGVGWYLVGSLTLVALTGCNPSFVGEQRAAWRGEAEQACLKSGAVRESPSVVLLPPINGPGVCGADYPLKVSMLGEGAPLGYEDEPVRPPSDVPRSASAYPRQPPQYPANPPYGAPAYPPPPGYPTNTPFAVNPAYPHDTRLPPNASYPPQPGDNRNDEDDYEPAAPYPDAQGAPAPAPYEPRASYPNAQQGPPPAPYRESAPYPPAPGPNGPVSLSPPGYEPPNADAPGDYQAPLPNYGAPNTVPARPPSRPSAHNGPFRRSYPGSGQIVPMSPSQNVAVAATASVSPPATLACPLVSVLDRWISEAVQPAAQKWFGQPVTGIRQISAYSCRGMNGNPNAHISEHAFGNALDIASFVLADGRIVTVEHGWHGLPEEQGFLRDVQGAACQMFTTVLAPGANVYHYNHIHVDLMRRARRPVICEPGAVAGDEIAARARARYARRDSGVTGAIGAHGDHQMRPSAYSGDDDRGLPDAVAGDD